MADDPYARIKELEAENAALRQGETGLAAENLAQRDRINLLTSERDEALEQQTATAEILRTIASSRKNAQPVLDAVVQSALQLSNSQHAMLGLREGDLLRVAALVGHYTSPPTFGALLPIGAR